MDSQQKIADLEAQVKRLSGQVQALLAVRPGIPQGAPQGAVLAPEISASLLRAYIWLNRLLLVLTLAVVSAAVALSLKAENCDVAKVIGIGPSFAVLNFRLLGCLMACATAGLFFTFHRRLVFIGMAWVTISLTYGLYFPDNPATLLISNHDYFWATLSVLSVCWALISLACMLDVHLSHKKRGPTAFLSVLNTGTFLAFTWSPIERAFPGHEWVFRLIVAGVLVMFCVLAETADARRNYLFQVFLAKAVLVFSLALAALLPSEFLWVALAFECLTLAYAYRCSGVVVLKLLDFLLMLVTLVGALMSVKLPGGVALGSNTVPANWFCCAGVSLMFGATAWLYEWLVRPRLHDERKGSGHWFLADTVLDISSGAAALWHAIAASLIVMSITIMDRGNDPTLPYLLAVEGCVFLMAGLLLRVPHLEIGCVLLLVGAHVSHYFFLRIGQTASAPQTDPVAYLLLLVVFTYVCAVRWERYLLRVHGGKPWEHILIASLPYLMATAMLTVFIGERLAWLYGPLAQNVLGVMLLLLGLVGAYSGFKTSGLLALGIGAATLIIRFHLFEPVDSTELQSPAYLVLILFTYVAGERLLFMLPSKALPTTMSNPPIRTALVAMAAALAALVLVQWDPDGYVARYWLMAALTAAVLAAACPELRYGWAALGLLAAAVTRVAMREEERAIGPYAYQCLGLAAAVLFLCWVTWARQRKRRHRQPKHAPSK